MGQQTRWEPRAHSKNGLYQANLGRVSLACARCACKKDAAPGDHSSRLPESLAANVPGTPFSTLAFEVTSMTTGNRS